MFLEKPAFSFSLSLSDVEKRVSSLLRKKGWENFTFASFAHGASGSHGHGSVFYIPYWFFSYDVHTNSHSKTKLLASGFSSLNAFSAELDSKISVLKKKEDVKKSNEVSDDYKTHVLEPKISENEAREVIAVRIAAGHEVAKDNVIVSGLEMVFVPIWLIEVNLDDHAILLRVNAVDGKILNASAVLQREKGFAELIKELLEDLSTPQGWVEYSSALVSDFSRAAKSPVKSKNNKVELDSEDKLVIILALIALLLILSAAFP